MWARLWKLLEAISSFLKWLNQRQAAAKSEAIHEAEEIQNDVGVLPPSEARKELKKW
jgi:hypothetical protein